MASTEERTAVCDAGPLIHLDELGSLDLLDGFLEIIIPLQVWHEVERHRPQALVSPRLGGLPLAVTIAQDSELQSLFQAFSLAEGEQAALSLLRFRRDDLLLSDDSAARLAAKILGIRSYGTLGLLLRAIRRGQRTRDEILAQLRQLPEISTLHVRPSLLAEIIEQVKAHPADQPPTDRVR